MGMNGLGGRILAGMIGAGCGALVTGASAYLALGSQIHQRPTATEVMATIEHELEPHIHRVESLEASVAANTELLQTIATRQAVMADRIDQIWKRGAAP